MWPSNSAVNHALFIVYRGASCAVKVSNSLAPIPFQLKIDGKFWSMVLRFFLRKYDRLNQLGLSDY